jgi:hypothetical protein
MDFIDTTIGLDLPKTAPELSSEPSSMVSEMPEQSEALPSSEYSTAPILPSEESSSSEMVSSSAPSEEPPSSQTSESASSSEDIQQSSEHSPRIVTRTITAFLGNEVRICEVSFETGTQSGQISIKTFDSTVPGANVVRGVVFTLSATPKELWNGCSVSARLSGKVITFNIAERG